MASRKPESLIDGPRRRSLAGPVIVAAQPTPVKQQTFQVTGQYVRGLEKGMEGLLKAVELTEELTFEGNLNLLSSLETTKEVLCCKYTEDCSSIAIGFTDGIIRLFKTSTNALLQTLYDAEAPHDLQPVTCIQHRPVSKNYPINNCITCTYTNGHVKCWNYNFGQCIYTIREKRQTFGVTYHPRLPKFITYGDDLKIYLYDEETRTQERILTSSEAPGSADGHVSRVFAACFNPRSNHEFVTGGWDDVVHFWDLRQPHALRRISGIHMCGEGIDISPKGTEMITCAWQRENPLQLWDYASGNLIVTMEPDVFESMLYSGRYLNKDFIVVGGSERNILRIIDLHNYTTIGSVQGLPGGVYSIDCGFVKKKKGGKEAPATKGAELASLPQIAFCCGRNVYQMDAT